MVGYSLTLAASLSFQLVVECLQIAKMREAKVPEAMIPKQGEDELDEEDEELTRYSMIQ
jgi:predicted kinase